MLPVPVNAFAPEGDGDLPLPSCWHCRYRGDTVLPVPVNGFGLEGDVGFPLPSCCYRGDDNVLPVPVKPYLALP